MLAEEVEAGLQGVVGDFSAEGDLSAAVVGGPVGSGGYGGFGGNGVVVRSVVVEERRGLEDGVGVEGVDPGGEDEGVEFVLPLQPSGRTTPFHRIPVATACRPDLQLRRRTNLPSAREKSPHNSLQAGLYFFGQHDSNAILLGAIFNDGSGTAPIHETDTTTGKVLEEYVSDTYRAASWLTVLGGLRQTRFSGPFTEDFTAPRIGLALRIPRLNWVFRGFYGRFYQPPPLITASGPVLAFASSNNTTLVPLHGERDEEHQFGVQIPFHGWLLDADTFKNRVNNFLDHSNIGDSSLYFPVTVDGALIRAWELTLRSPRVAHLGQFHLAYSNQIGEQRGNITGGLICTPIGDPFPCDAGFASPPPSTTINATPSTSASTPPSPAPSPRPPTSTTAPASTTATHDPATPYPNAYLPAHTSVDLALGKSFGERLTASNTATNVSNRRLLLDNSTSHLRWLPLQRPPPASSAELRYRFRVQPFLDNSYLHINTLYIHETPALNDDQVLLRHAESPEKFYKRDSTKAGIVPSRTEKLRDQLTTLDAAEKPGDMSNAPDGIIHRSKANSLVALVSLGQ